MSEHHANGVRLILTCVAISACGCQSNAIPKAPGTCRPMHFCCDDYCGKRQPVTCDSSRPLHRDDYRRKCLPAAMTPRVCTACDDFQPKSCPAVCESIDGESFGTGCAVTTDAACDAFESQRN